VLDPAAPRLSTLETEGVAWDESFAGWRGTAGERLVRAYSDAINRKLLARWLPPATGSLLKTDLFDEVAGTGLVGLLLERAERVCGIDVAPTVVSAAGAAYPRLEAEVADVRALPFPGETFDVVVSTSTLDHFDSKAGIREALKELFRVLRPGGTLVVTVDNGSNPLVALRNALPSALLRRAGLVPYPIGKTCRFRELQGVVESAGFEIDAVDVVMHVPRLAVRASARLVSGHPSRADRLVSRLTALEPPRRLPGRVASGQFVAALARRPAGEEAPTPEAPGA